jgi:hypothetical protein
LVPQEQELQGKEIMAVQVVQSHQEIMLPLVAVAQVQLVEAHQVLLAAQVVLA